MKNTLQNRLVGTIIVVALVVIFVPEFLDGEKRVNQQAFVDVPPASKLVEVNAIKRFDPSSVEDELNRSVEVIDETPVDASDSSNGDKSKQQAKNNTEIAKDVSQENTKQVASIQRKPVEQTARKKSESNEIDIKDAGWVVQLGSFQHQKNVRELMKTLNDAGYRAYTRPVKTTVGELTKVFVGPELDREKLELALPHLQKITKLKGKITAFEVSAG